MALHAGATPTGTFTASSAVYSAGATTLDLTDATSFAGGSVRFGSSTSIIYDAANSIGVRNGANAQTFSVYNTFTAGTPDYERLELTWSAGANVAGIRMMKNGTGTARNLVLYYGNTSVGALQIGTAVNAGVMLVGSATSAVSSSGRFAIPTSASVTATSGTNYTVLVAEGYLPTATSTMVAIGIGVTPTINYSNGTPGAGSVYCVYIKPTNTALPTGINGGVVHASTSSGLTGCNVYFNTSDETTNTEYIYEKFNTNVWEIGSVKTGGGTLRGLRFGITGNSIGFLGHAVQALPSAYTLNATVVTSRTLLASASATAANCNNVLAQLIQDLQGYGLLA